MPGERIGKIHIGMTRSAITRVAGPGRRLAPSHAAYRFRIYGVPVRVTFGRSGRARSLIAASGRLAINGVPLSRGPDAIQAVLPEAKRDDCGDFYSFFELVKGSRRTSMVVLNHSTAPQLPWVQIYDSAIRI